MVSSAYAWKGDVSRSVRSDLVIIAYLHSLPRLLADSNPVELVSLVEYKHRRWNQWGLRLVQSTSGQRRQEGYRMVCRPMRSRLATAVYRRDRGDASRGRNGLGQGAVWLGRPRNNELPERVCGRMSHVTKSSPASLPSAPNALRARPATVRPTCTQDEERRQFQARRRRVAQVPDSFDRALMPI